ncbi:TetR/AcrR family transcriptional regulator [Mycolicibacterium aichiense]|uniref:TetR family transcriptional regulator n=1 Tax=Mycolicibacterium aichiense TaxID=1799 RepID=A0AAD1HK48_9MYCO|nr:TetR/AcrR family transcriptional regulator [Mycolicibacterium aichiense]MCV7019745.1 TetR family transcriptional regulator [Mycolicibacterium aichiense]BBX06882.1 TetR family transcriptional regulator [Mycolicibacterium aichiense]STZ80699.1 transcriptional regulator [Mycolicibacterium aichiense]
MAASHPQPRNAAATREAILKSAIENFAKAGYDGVGVRQIAHDAGVTAMLVNRYFGSKEGLFAEAVETAFATPVFVSEQSDSLVADIVEALVAGSGSRADAPQPFLIMLRSASNPVATTIVRKAIERHVGARLTRQLDSSDRELRSEILLAVISGMLMMRGVVGTRALRKGKAADIARVLEPMVAALIDDPQA